MSEIIYIYVYLYTYTGNMFFPCFFDRWMSRFIFKILSRNGSLVESPTADTTGTTARVRELIQKHLQDAPMQFLRPILANQKDWKPRKKKTCFFLRKMLGI